MVSKVRCIAALIVVMSLIYIQQSSVIYAGENHSGGDRTRVEEGSTPAEGEDKMPTEGEDKQPSGGEEDKPPTEGEEDKPPIEGEDKPPSEGEDKPPIEGEDKPPIEGEDKPPSEGEDKPPVEEEKKTIEEYKITIPKADGKQGYFTEKPEIAICHVSETGVTKYCLKHGDKKLEEKSLKKKGEKAVIEGKVFSEGKNVLHVWMEDEEGKKIDTYELKKEILIDTEAPEIQMSVPKGFEAWYRGQVTLFAACEDPGSGVTKISCKEGEKALGSINKKQGKFVISQTSLSGKGVDVTVTAEDKAGNKSERIKTVFIDKAAPEVTIAGAENYMITGKTVKLSYEINEENMLQEFYAQTLWENVKGKKRQLSSEEWRNDGTAKILTQTLKNDGLYHVKVQARDMSGNVSEKELQVIIDKTNPVIRYVERLDGKQLKKFKWDYPAQQMIQDFTTYAYEMRIDGQLYHMGDTVKAEGKHRMTVKATDAAGNKAQAAADFVVDHTAPEIVFCNIEEGKEYEEERTFGVELTKEEDTIFQIQINGEKQKIDSGTKTYECTLRTCKDYEVTVKASDRAGNVSVKSIFFQIVPKKSFVGRITDSLKARGSTGQKADTQFPETIRQEKGRKNHMPILLKAAGVGVLGGIISVAGILYYKLVYKKRNRCSKDRGSLREERFD